MPLCWGCWHLVALPKFVHSTLRQEVNYGVFRHSVAYAGAGVERNSLLPNLPPGMDAGQELLAGRTGEVPENWRMRMMPVVLSDANCDFQWRTGLALLSCPLKM